MSHIIQVARCESDALTGQYLQGPRTPAKVRRDGYGFTPDIREAWPFDSRKQAEAKARIVTRHMSWHPTQLEAITP